MIGKALIGKLSYTWTGPVRIIKILTSWTPGIMTSDATIMNPYNTNPPYIMPLYSGESSIILCPT